MGEARKHVLVHVAAVPVERTAQVLYALLVRFTGEIHVVICPRKPIEELGGVAALDVKQRFAVVIRRAGEIGAERFGVGEAVCPVKNGRRFAQHGGYPGKAGTP